MRWLVFTSVLWLWGCASSTNLAHLPEGVLDPDWHYLDYHDLLDKMGETSLRGEGPDTYRMTVFSGVSPIHSVRVEDAGGHAQATVSSMTTGYRMKGPVRLAGRYDRRKPLDVLQDIEAVYQAVGFSEGVSDPGHDMEDGALCVHPTYFLFEQRRDNRHHFIMEDVCNATGLTYRGGPAFYDAVGVDRDDEWSLAEWLGMGEDG